MAFKDFLNSVAASAMTWAEKQQEEYENYYRKYSCMGEQQLINEWKRNASRICSKAPQLKAFRESCESYGLIIMRQENGIRVLKRK